MKKTKLIALYVFLTMTLFSTRLKAQSEILEKIIGLYNEQKYSEVIKLARNAVSSDTLENARIKFMLGLSNLYSGNFREAAEALKASLALDSGNINANYYLGISYMKLKEYNLAEAQFSVVLEKSADEEYKKKAAKHLDRIRRKMEK